MRHRADLVSQREVIALKQLSLTLLCMSALSAFGQAPARQYQRGTITGVTTHQGAPREDGSEVAHYA